jgi:16S rRNA (adenine1518-N6/adenine1519-N6)-dimethyltransferase
MSGTWRPKRRLGQHLLVDRAARQRILAALPIERGDAVVEIGPGRGALTAGLIELAGRIAAVEADRELVGPLRSRFDERSLLLIQEDVLSVTFSSIATALRAGGEGRLTVVGNLPYNISKPVAMKLVRERASIGCAVLMFQREVARRLTSPPRKRDYGPLTVLAGRFYRIERLFDVGPRSFRPVPRVVSTVTRWHRRPGPDLSPPAERILRQTLASCFARRRQTVRNNLRAALGRNGAEDLLVEAEIDGSRRAEALAPEEFERLAEAWPRQRSSLI